MKQRKKNLHTMKILIYNSKSFSSDIEDVPTNPYKYSNMIHKRNGAGEVWIFSKIPTHGWKKMNILKKIYIYIKQNEEKLMKNVVNIFVYFIFFSHSTQFSVFSIMNFLVLVCYTHKILKSCLKICIVASFILNFFFFFFIIIIIFSYIRILFTSL